ncbi:MAG: hypothetical protein HY866_23505 [Chloroflexi bacterium]|nr:hypothetical protein [Chloroflexota bacterium]
MTYLWPDGLPIQVESDEQGAPLCFTWEGTHKVDNIANRWRVDDDWWRGRVWREYFKLTTDTGLLVILFRDVLSGDWFLQRLYD